MARSLRYLFLLLCLSVTRIAFAQTAPGEIRGVVLDDKKDPVINAVVQAMEGNIVKGGAVTDIDGNYSIKPLDPGRYNVTVKGLSYKETTVTDVIVSPDKTTGLNFSMEPNNTSLTEHVVIAYKIPLVDKYAPGGSTTITSEQIEKMPTRETNDVAATSAGVYQSQRGATLNIGGARDDGTLYVIDGVQVQGSAAVNLTQNSIDQIEVLTSGLSAKYGDASGGVINITTKGVSQKFTGDVLLQHSIDGYNNNLASMNISGPLYSKKLKDGSKKPLMGFALGAEYYDDHDRYPSYYEPETLKGSELQNLQQNPLVKTTDASGNPIYQDASNYVTNSDLTSVKVPANNVIQEARLNGKLDFQVTDNMNVTAGANFNYNKTDLYSYQLGLFSPNSIPVNNNITGRGFIRLTQRFGKEASDSGKKSIISNAYYSIQGDYQKEEFNVENPTFKSNIFDYQYLGQFDETKTPIYTPLKLDSASNRYGTVYGGDQTTGISYDRSNMNPLLANYTSQYYGFLGGELPTSIQQIEAQNALANGDLPLYTYGLFPGVGTSQAYYEISNSNQYALNVDASFDLQLGRTKHAIEFGLYYQQRVESSFVSYSNPNGTGTNSIYELMRQLVSSEDNGKLALDTKNPIFVVNGKRYTLAQVNNGSVIPNATDTILYNYTNINQTTFDANLRRKLGLSSTADINIDALNPNTFSLGMFSADELLNSGNPFVQYQGYSYTGAVQSGNVNFDDYFTQKNANGDYTRPIGAFRPNYIAGYILDKFQLKDILFNVGARIERYDANTDVLIDPYSLYPEKNVSEVAGSSNIINGGAHPSNIGSNYVVYVDDNSSSSPQVVGYRSGNNWYDPKGNYIEDPSVLTQYTGGRDPQPYLVNPNVHITDSSFKPNQSFTQYTPQVHVMPRISFTFPISDVAMFYAHYDIYYQRPTSGIDGTPYQYYFLQQNSNSIINNPDLKPEETFDYEVGFQQKLSDQSAVTISGFYKERKNMITVEPYLYAWPTTYYTFGNRDFSTTKGMTLKYDLRRINHLRMNIAYTLQFAEGTGSGVGSTNGGNTSYVAPYGILSDFISAQLPNLRYIAPLDYDTRHNINTSLDYRYDDGEGPIVGGMHILQNAGINLLFKTRSGEPYTAYSLPDNVSHTVVGGVNQSRLPWHYDVDLKVDKDFALSVGKRRMNKEEGVKPKKPLYLNAFILVQNLLNTRDVLHVYGYTGKPDDVGYLTSAFGQQYVPQQIDPAAYSDQFTYDYNNPANYNYARTINLGVEFAF